MQVKNKSDDHSETLKIKRVTPTGEDTERANSNLPLKSHKHTDTVISALQPALLSWGQDNYIQKKTASPEKSVFPQ